MQGMFSYQGRCIISALLGALIGAVFGIFSLYHGGVLFTVPAGIFAGLFSANAVTIARSILRGALVAAVVQLLILIAFDAAGMASSSGSEFVMEQLLWVACGLSLGSIVGIVTWTFPKWIAWVVMFACGGLFFSSEYQYQRNLSVNALFVPVQICAEVANGEIIRLLLWNGAEMNDSDWFGNTPMHWAASSGKQDIIQLLLAQRASVNPLNHFNNTPLHFAVQRGRKEIVQLLLDSGATANVSNYAGNTPLHLAARRNFAEIAETLIKAQANIHAKNRNGKTPIDLAAVAGNRQLSQFFETGRLPRQSRVPGAEETIWERQEDLIEKLQQQEALILKQRPDLEPLFKHLTAEQAKGGSMTLSEIEAQEVGEAFCMFAARIGETQGARMLISAGAEINAKDRRGETALAYARKNGYSSDSEICKVISDAGGMDSSSH